MDSAVNEPTSSPANIPVNSPAGNPPGGLVGTAVRDVAGLAGKVARDIWLVFQRQNRLILRTPVRLLVGIAQPLAYLMLFAPLLKEALAPVGADTYNDAYRIYVPGLLTVLILLSGFFTGFALLADLRAGIVERSRVTPMSRFALMFGRTLSEVLMMMGQAVIIIVLATTLFGLRVNLGYLLLACLLLIMMGIFGSSVSYALAMRVRNVAALGPMITAVSQPLMLLSGVLLPLTLAPVWLVSVAEWNPFYWAVNGMRALFAGNITDNAVWQAFAINIVLTALALTWATRTFATRVR